jgi:hypothetical protein
MVFIEVVMTVTYKTNAKFPGINFPVLHRVVYDRLVNETVQARLQRSYKDHLVTEWLKANCRHPYYTSPGYIHDKFIEFECDEEAMIFALRWAK